MYLSNISGPLTDIKCNPHSAATALASIVLPHPGGPYSMTPEGSLIGARRYKGAYNVGNSNVSFNCRLTCKKKEERRKTNESYVDAMYCVNKIAHLHQQDHRHRPIQCLIL